MVVGLGLADELDIRRRRRRAGREGMWIVNYIVRGGGILMDLGRLGLWGFEYVIRGRAASERLGFGVGKWTDSRRLIVLCWG